MKYFFRIFIFFSVFIVSKLSAQTSYSTMMGDTLVKLNLLSDNRVVFEEYPNDRLFNQNKGTSATQNGKKICLTFASIYYSSYGKYKMEGDSIIISFSNENPIERIDVVVSKVKKSEDKTEVTIQKEFDQFFDLEVYQNKFLLQNMLPWEETSKIEVTNVNNPLVFEIDAYTKQVYLKSDYDTTIKVFCNEFKRYSHRREGSLVFDLSSFSKTEGNK